MNSTTISLISFGCIFGGALIGLGLRKLLPENHLSSDSKDAVKVGAGMISMMSALVLGLLVSSAKQNFDATGTAIVQSGAKIILLDRVLAIYGPESLASRETLKQGVASSIKLLWPEDRSLDPLKLFEKNVSIEQVIQEIRKLRTETEVQRSLQQQAISICNDLMLTRWIQIEQSQTSLPPIFLVILLFWLTMLYLSFGLLAPHNSTVLAAMFVGALALATALFLILEMNHPMSGTMRVSSGPMIKALEHLGP